jgi:DNA-binding transcriptional ArsR family regulator
MKEYFRKMSFRSAREATIRDPAVLRALAHPVRTALLSRLYVGPATATECAESVGESPSSCSYHLRVLARHGFVEETPTTDGRERRWKAVIMGYSYEPDDTPEGRAAYGALTSESLRIARERLEAYRRAEAALPKEWTDAAQISTGAFYASPAELDELMTKMSDLLEPYFDRVDPAKRPPNTDRVAFHMYAVPWFVTNE